MIKKEINASKISKTHLLIGVDEKNGANCLQLTPFGFVTSTGQISIKFMDDLNRLAYWM